MQESEQALCPVCRHEIEIVDEHAFYDFEAKYLSQASARLSCPADLPREATDAIRAAGIADDRIVLDPGLGFAKEPHHNWELLRELDVLAGLGFPLLVGASRKTFLGRLLEASDGTPRAVDAREDAGVALSALLAAGLGGAPVWCLRVHDVRAHRDALAVAAQWGSAGADRAAPSSGEESS